MQYFETPDHMKEFVARAQANYWSKIDVDAHQPVIHGEPIPAEEQARRARELEKAEALQREYEESLKNKQ